MASASARVFGIAELVEEILFQLPPLYLLRAQAVNSTFYDTIEASGRLQEKLFFCERDDRPADGSSLLNPFIKQMILRCADCCSLSIMNRQCEELASLILDADSGGAAGDTLVEIPRDHIVLIRARGSRSYPSAAEQIETWRNMHAADPYCVFAVQIENKNEGGFEALDIRRMFDQHAVGVMYDMCLHENDWATDMDDERIGKVWKPRV